MRRHDTQEISAMLRRADDMMQNGKSQKEVCKTLGISVMTFHRWRKLPSTTNGSDLMLLDSAVKAPADEGHVEYSTEIDALKLENHRLRRIVSDLLLEKMKIQESLEKSGR